MAPLKEKAVESEKPSAQAELRSVEDWAEELKPASHMLAGARVLKGWARGRMLTRSAFEAGMEEMMGLKVGVGETQQHKER